jgi:hypothetical protein
MRQHLASIERSHLTNLRVILDETFNKSVCLDLESWLIEMLSGDGAFEVLSRNDGIVNADYYNRAFYQGSFDVIFDRLKLDGVFTRTIPEIINSDLFKLSPFKSLTDDQAFAVEGVVKSLFDDLRSTDRSTTVIQGDPAQARPSSTDLDALDDDGDSLFSEFFTDEHRMLLRDRIGFTFPLLQSHCNNSEELPSPCFAGRPSTLLKIRQPPQNICRSMARQFGADSPLILRYRSRNRRWLYEIRKRDHARKRFVL